MGNTTTILFVFITIFIFICNVNFGAIIVTDVSPENSHGQHPTNSNQNSCDFTFYLSAHDTSNIPGTFVFSSSPVVSLNNVLSNSTSSLYSITIVNIIGTYSIVANFKKGTYSGSVEIKYVCEAIDYQSPNFKIEVLPLLSELSIIGLQVSNTYIKLTGPKYPIQVLDLLVEGLVENAMATTQANIFYYKNKVKFDSTFSETLKFNVLISNVYTSPLLSMPPLVNKYSNNSFFLYTEYPEVQTFNEPCYHCSPIYSIQTKITDYAPFLNVQIGNLLTTPVPMKRDTEFIYYFARLTYTDSDSGTSLPISVFNQISTGILKADQGSVTIMVKKPNDLSYTPIVTYLPRGGTDLLQNSDMFTFQMNANVLPYDFYPYKFQLKESSITLGSPFGLVGDNINFSYKASFIGQTKVENILNVLTLYYGPVGNYKIFNLDAKVETLPPATTLTFFEGKILYGYYLFRFQVNSLDHFSGIRCGTKLYGYDSFTINENGDSIFEIIVEFNPRTFGIIDKFDRTIEYQFDGYYSISPALKIEFPKSSINQFTIKNVWFLINEIDVTDKQVSNVMYISFNQMDLVDIYNAPMVGLALWDPISYDYDVKLLKPFYAKFNLDLQLFIIEFNVPANTLSGIQSYSILFGDDLTFSNINLPPASQLHVKSQQFNARAPMVTQAQTFETTTAPYYIYWIYDIDSQINGFSHGEIIIRGSVDNSFYKFDFTTANMTYGDQFKGTYTFLIPISHQVCFKQKYVLEKISLFNNVGLRSFYSISNDNDNVIQNPFITFLGGPISAYGEYTLTNSNCVANDLSLPILDSFTTNPSKSSTGSQMVSFSFQVTDSDSGIKQDQLPIVYLMTDNFKTIQCVSRVDTALSFNVVLYKCEIELPYGFGYKSDIIYSVYGLTNNGGRYSGYSTNDLKGMGFDYFMKQEIELLERLEITGTSKIGSNSGDLWVFGRGFRAGQTSVLIKYDGEIEFKALNVLKDTSKIYYSALFVDGIKGTKLPFTIKATTNDGVFKESNEYIVIPIVFDYVIVNPTNPPQLCLGNPQCGGPNQGFCNNSTGCICYSPWIGKDCSSKVVIVPQPNTNTTNPTTETDTTLFKSLISLISIREFDFKNIQVAEYKFNKWVYNELDSTTNQYFTNITVNSDDSTTNTITPIKVTLQWFKDSTNITFANEQLLMNPSTIKYTIEIGSYKFKNNLNTLQLIISATFIKDSTDEICSVKEFGETSNGDNSNYIKLQIKDHSLYGRFIKRAIVDGIVKTINNTPLDDSLGSIENSASKSQSYIGMNIPNYQNSITIDPDFSVLLDNNEVDSDNENSICNTSSKLTTSQLAGIIVAAGVIFLAIVGVGVFLFIKKRKHTLLLLGIRDIAMKKKIIN